MFIAELPDGHVWQRTKILGWSHNWMIKTFSKNEYICTNCCVEIIGANNLGDAPKCLPQIIPRSWLGNKHTHSLPPIKKGTQ